MLGSIGRGLSSVGKGARNTVRGMWEYRFNPNARKYYDETHTIAPSIIEQRVSSEPLNFPKSLHITEEEELSPSEKALRNIKAHQAKFAPVNIPAEDPGVRRSSNSGNSIVTVASDPGVRRSFLNGLTKQTRRRENFWKPTPSKIGGRRKYKKTRKQY